MRRAFALLVLAVTLALVIGVPTLPPTRAQPPVPLLTLTVLAGPGTQLVFDPTQIKIPQVPIILNITVINNGTSGAHTFTINDAAGTPKIDVSVPSQNVRRSVQFQINESATVRGAIGEIFFNRASFRPQPSANGIRFYCVPHETVGMVGEIVLATVGGGAVEEKGFFLRAYWIGIIALAAMLLWIGITYFLVKGSSAHFTNHHEHMRRGLP